MPQTIVLQKIRDRKERELSALVEVYKSCESQVKKTKDNYKKKLDQYQVWKTEQEIEGILY